MPYNSKTSAYERRAATVIDATPDGDTVAIAIDVKLDQGIDDYVTDLNHHAGAGYHYPAPSVGGYSRFLKQSPAGVVSWVEGVVAADAALKDMSNVASGAISNAKLADIAPSKITQNASNRFFTDTERTKLTGIETGAQVTSKARIEAALTGEITSHTHMVGELVWATGAAPLPGTIAANGAILSRTTYSRLWAYARASGNISVDDASWTEGRYSPGDGATTFRVPKVDNRFIRGKSATRNVGLVEEDAIRNIVGEASRSNTSGIIHSDIGIATGAFERGPSTFSIGTNYMTTSPYNSLVFDASNVVPTADENRPKALTMLPCIVY